MAVTEAAAAAMPDRRRRVTILGATGSVGRSTADLLLRHRDRYAVEALTAHRDVVGLAQLARDLRPRLAVIGDPDAHDTLRAALAGTGIATAAGTSAVVEAASRPVDWVMAAIVGMAGLAPTMAAIRAGATVAFASKECLVAAGPVMMAAVARHHATLLPVDSEHNAIFQVFDGVRPDSVERIILTASGGPFRDRDPAELEDVTPEQAVAHPNWRMGAKISVDSATMMNKGLEVIEAHHLFAMPEERIEVVVHPQSIVHSLVAYVDGSVLAQLGAPDMRTPIAHALAWPERISTPSARLDLAAIGSLTFMAPDPRRFPALALARHALCAGGGVPAVLNAANEVAVAAFLARRIGFLEIVRVVERTLERMAAPTPADIGDVVALDAEARRIATTTLADGAASA
ncbi:MAG: 1-deoxy-D-xylulose-5-phosphate reductoisomerase [Alphaproteobacteria bacterium]|nr:1-deoxy-D-xylulose-5-phosphate reductoisomerase [Alphaproteobacteria bacterium]